MLPFMSRFISSSVAGLRMPTDPFAGNEDVVSLSAGFQWVMTWAFFFVCCFCWMHLISFVLLCVAKSCLPSRFTTHPSKHPSALSAHSDSLRLPHPSSFMEVFWVFCQPACVMTSSPTSINPLSSSHHQSVPPLSEEEECKSAFQA